MAEDVANPAQRAGGVDDDEVEADASRAPGGVSRKQDLGRGEEPRALFFGKRLRGLAEALAGFHLDEGEQAVLFGDDVDLAGRGALAAGLDRPSVRLERGDCQRLGAFATQPPAAAGQAAGNRDGAALGDWHLWLIASNRPQGTRRLEGEVKCWGISARGADIRLDRCRRLIHSGNLNFLAVSADRAGVGAALGAV